MLSNFNMSKLNESYKKDIASLFIKSEPQEIIIIYFLHNVFKRLKFPLVFILIFKYDESYWMQEIRYLFYIWL